MAILAKKTGGSGSRDLGPPAPDGAHHAVCVDVIDLGKQTQTYEGRSRVIDMVLIIWQLAKRDEKAGGRRYLVAKKYNNSLNEKATLRKDLQSWSKRQMTRDEEDHGFDLERLIGVNAQVIVQQVTKDSGTYGNVIAVLPKDADAKKIIAENYTREAAAPEDEHDADDSDDAFATHAPAPAAGVPAAAPAPVTDDDIPF